MTEGAAVGGLLRLLGFEHAAPAAELIVPVVGTVGAFLVGWHFKGRDARRADNAGIMQGANQLVDQLQEELVRTAALVGKYSDQLELLKAARYAIDDLIVELRDQTIAARAMVHELQARLGEPPTSFPPLPRPRASRDPPG